MWIIKSKWKEGDELPLVVDPARLREWVEAIAKPRHAGAQPEANRETAEWLAMELASMGYVVKFDGPHRNVIALRKEAPTSIALVGAHYDSVWGSPGADDNASGIAVLLACAARVTSAAVGFVCFNGEEDGLLGSMDFVPRWKDRIAVAHILEMVGYASEEVGSQRRPPGLPIPIPDTANFLGILASRDSNADLEAVIEVAGHLPALPVVGLKTFLGIEKKIPVLLRSDHAPFWDARVPALMWTDTSEFRNPNYHKKTDTPDTLNYPFMARVASLLTACLEEEVGV